MNIIKRIISAAFESFPIDEAKRRRLLKVVLEKIKKEGVNES